MTKLYCSRGDGPDGYHTVEGLKFQPSGDELICPDHNCQLSTFKPRRTSLSPSNPSSPKRRKPMARKQPKRDWKDAREKVELEGRCRVCGSESRSLEAAHIIGRKHDEERDRGVLYVDPNRIVPLCGALESGLLGELPHHGCHQKYDRHEIDLLQHLSLPEQIQAVVDAGSIESARVRLAPSAYKEFVDG